MTDPEAALREAQRESFVEWCIGAGMLPQMKAAALQRLALLEPNAIAATPSPHPEAALREAARATIDYLTAASPDTPSDLKHADALRAALAATPSPEEMCDHGRSAHTDTGCLHCDCRHTYSGDLAATPSPALDVERLARAIASAVYESDPNPDDMVEATRIAREYAALSESDR